MEKNQNPSPPCPNQLEIRERVQYVGNLGANDALEKP
jgi:hypothetical protein